jgi:thioredoxin 1
VPAPVSPRLQAFYGDAGLRDFLVQRLGAHLDAGDVVASFRPYWVDGAGTFAAALVHTSDAEVFERVTGLPYGVACVLDFLAIDNRADCVRLFAAITPATDLASVPLRFVQAWLGAAEHRWADVLAVPELDQLRRDWLDMSARWLAGRMLPGDDWAALQARAQALVSTGNDAWRQLDDDVASMLAMLAPPPPPGDARWGAIITARAAFSRARLLEFNAGWTRHDIARPVLMIRWLQAHVELDSDGRPDQDSLRRGQQQNPHNDAFFDAQREQHHARYPELMRQINAPFIERMIAILAGQLY